METPTIDDARQWRMGFPETSWARECLDMLLDECERLQKFEAEMRAAIMQEDEDMVFAAVKHLDEARQP